MDDPARGPARVVALPGLILAAFGYLAHPGFLDASTADLVDAARLPIPVFPLISLAVVLLLRGVGGPAWAARITAYGFATFYTALDVLSGIGAGLAVEAGAGDLVGRLFEIGDALGRAGVWMLASALLTGAALVRRDGLAVLPGALVLAGACFPFMTGHIFPSDGSGRDAADRARLRADGGGPAGAGDGGRPPPLITGCTRGGDQGVPAGREVGLFGGAANFLHGHIYWPSGGLAMLGVAGGCGWLVYAAGSRPDPQRGGPTPVRS